MTHLVVRAISGLKFDHRIHRPRLVDRSGGPGGLFRAGSFTCLISRLAKDHGTDHRRKTPLAFLPTGRHTNSKPRDRDKSPQPEDLSSQLPDQSLKFLPTDGPSPSAPLRLTSICCVSCV